MRARRLAGLAAAVVTTAAAGFVVPLLGAAPASAAACSGETGVTVLVDFNELGGGVQSVCSPDGGYADDLYDAVGFELSYASRQPGFVCRVEGAPSTDQCVNTAPADAYWGLWWSDGDAGSGWTYSSLGVGSLKLPDGALVALAWDQNDGDERPSAASTRPAPTTPSAPPTTVAPSAPATSAPTEQPSSGGGSDPSAPATSAPTEAPTTAVPTEQPSSSAGSPDAEPWSTATPPAPTPAPDATTPAVPDDQVAPTAAEPADASGQGLPGWVAPVLIVLLFAAAGGTLLLRRRGNQS